MNEKKRTSLEPLTFSCSSTDCPNGLHSFGGTRTRRGSYPKNTCRECGVRLVDWERVRKNDLGDINFTIAELKKEFIRHQYWCSMEIDQKAINKARRKGVNGTRSAAEHRLAKHICKGTPFRSGMTPYIQRRYRLLRTTCHFLMLPQVYGTMARDSYRSGRNGHRNRLSHRSDYVLCE